VVFFLVIYLSVEQASPQNLSGWGVGIALSLSLMGSVLIHELAHLIMSRKWGIRVSSIRLFFFGGIAQVSSEPSNGRQEFLIAIVGPAASVLLGTGCAFLYIISIAAGIEGNLQLVLGVLSFANIALGLINMIPGLPLDGGRMLRALLWERWNDLARATRVASQLGNSFALTLVFMGILQLFANPNLLIGLLFILLGLSLKQASLGGYQFTVLSESLAGIPIGQVMTTKLVSVDWLMSIEDFVRDYVFHHRHAQYPVYNRGEIQGIVLADRAQRVPKDLWGFKQVRDIMTPIEQVPHLNPSDDAGETLKQMLADDQAPMPVIEGGQLLGIVSRHDILKAFRAQPDKGVPGHPAEHASD
jgi:Zn-dependent protease/predicted transcriptional regulator